MALPLTIPDTHALVPDNLLGLEYEGGGYGFYLVEIDRSTERLRAKSGIKNSIERKLLAYQNVFERNAHKERLGISSGTVLFATVSEARAEHFIELVKATVLPRFQGRFLAKAFEGFGELRTLPKELLDVFGPWRGVKGPVDISKA
jgi:hypothetical protein